MAKLLAVSLQRFSPMASEYTKLATTSDGELSITTKYSCILHPNLTSVSATLLTSQNTCCTLKCWNLPNRDLQFLYNTVFSHNFSHINIYIYIYFFFFFSFLFSALSLSLSLQEKIVPNIHICFLNIIWRLWINFIIH